MYEFRFSFWLIIVVTMYIATNSAISVCPRSGMFPDWMIGNFHAEFADGSSANGTFHLWHANVTFSTGERGRLTMTAPLQVRQDFYVFHECVHIQRMTPAFRCSLLVRNTNGYVEYIHMDPQLVSTCPDSLDEPGLEIETVLRID
jgi:hypothetical protein